MLLLLSAEVNAATRPVERPYSAGLQWSRPPVGRHTVVAAPTTRAVQVRSSFSPQLPTKRLARTTRGMSTGVMTAAWQEDEQQRDQINLVAVEQSTPVFDPFEEDDLAAERLAQLPDDPFDEPTEESIPVPEPEEELETVESALEEEIKRRQLENEIFEEEEEDILESDSKSIDPLAEDLLKELEAGDEEGGRLQLDRNALDLELDFDRAQEEQIEEPTPEELEERRKELAQERLESEESCRDELQEVENDRISTIDLSIRVTGNAGEDYPYECAVSSQLHEPRQWPEITYHWKASALCHKPLYFEQVQLERYGHSWGPYVQPIMSGVHFFGTLPVLPYKMGIRTPCECVYTLGYYRPGSCAPYMIDPIPFTWRAALFEGAAATGISFAIP